MAKVAFMDIPEDVLIYIFKLAIPEAENPSNIQSPLNISHTNRILRQITIENPSLWSYMYLKATDEINFRWGHLLDLWIR